ncbi:MAG: AI-2E family transporter [Dongiaceae bacterium]
MKWSERIEQFMAVAALLAVAAGSFVVLQPFLSAILWSIILCFATWPVFMWLLDLLGGRRNLAALAMTILLAVFLILPFAIVGPRLAEEATFVSSEVAGILALGPPEPPAWVRELPVIGASLADYWSAAAQGTVSLSVDLKPYLDQGRNWLIRTGVNLGEGVVQLVLSVVIAFFVYRDGRALSVRLSNVTARFAGERAKALLQLAGDTTRGVVYGVFGTALAQGLLAGVGFYIVGLKSAVFLGLLTFFLSFIPGGPPFVWLPAGIWLLIEGEIAKGILILLYGLLVISTIDNILRPYFISRGGRLPFLLVFLGVLGGIVAFGFIGVFLGPVLLAVGFSLAKEWSGGELGNEPPKT